MANTIGIVTKIQNEVFVKTVDGETRRLNLGDKVFRGDVVLTSTGSTCEITPDIGAAVQFQEQTTATLTDDVFKNIDGGVQKESIDQLKASVAQTIIDPNQLIEDEAAAAGIAAGGGESEGNTFVQILRIIENVDPASYLFPLNPNEDPPVILGQPGDLEQDLSEKSVPVAPILSVWNDSLHNGEFDTKEDNQAATITYSSWSDDNNSGTDKVFIGDLLKEGKPITKSNLEANPPAETVMNYTSDITFTFLSEGAGYKNAVGWYDVNNPDVGHVIWENASALHSGGSLVNGNTVTVQNVSAGTEIGFFLIPDSYNIEGVIPDTIYFHNGRAYKNAEHTKLIDSNDNGMPGEVDPVWFSNSTNIDNLQHVITGISANDDPNVLYVGFEDLGRGGDKDYNDVVFKVDLGEGNGVKINPISFDLGVTISDQDSLALSKAVLDFNIGSDDTISFDNVAGLTVNHLGNNYYEITGNASILDYNDLLDSFKLQINTDSLTENTVTERFVNVQVWDETNQASNIDTAYFNVTPLKYDNAPLGDA